MATLTTAGPVRFVEIEHSNDLQGLKQNGTITQDTIDNGIIFCKQDKTIICRGSKYHALNEPIYYSYKELAELKSSNQLVPGQKYALIDYCVCNFAEIEVEEKISGLTIAYAGNNMELVLTACAENQFEPECQVLSYYNVHDGVKYTNIDYPGLAKWQVWYDFDGNQDTYQWAMPDLTEEESESGNWNTRVNGVIYRMIDDNGNEAYYDFKNILFPRYKPNRAGGYLTEYTNNLDNGFCIQDTIFPKFAPIYDKENALDPSFVYFYTFSYMLAEDNAIDGTSPYGLYEEIRMRNTKIFQNNKISCSRTYEYRIGNGEGYEDNVYNYKDQIHGLVLPDLVIQTLLKDYYPDKPCEIKNNTFNTVFGSTFMGNYIRHNVFNYLSYVLITLNNSDIDHGIEWNNWTNVYGPHFIGCTRVSNGYMFNVEDSQNIYPYPDADNFYIVGTQLWLVNNYSHHINFGRTFIFDNGTFQQRPLY